MAELREGGDQRGGRVEAIVDRLGDRRQHLLWLDFSTFSWKWFQQDATG
jgi:hypothetical protein